ncbi:hypothetical protein V8G54_030850 [Vigna mungo]|uniref:Secreted protein n=1 Tax=Vigna mungo TaxID=3915 RepID=A0AAQ3MXS5_VIGMU
MSFACFWVPTALLSSLHVEQLIVCVSSLFSSLPGCVSLVSEVKLFMCEPSLNPSGFSSSFKLLPVSVSCSTLTGCASGDDDLSSSMDPSLSMRLLPSLDKDLRESSGLASFSCVSVLSKPSLESLSSNSVVTIVMSIASDVWKCSAVSPCSSPTDSSILFDVISSPDPSSSLPLLLS